MKTEASDQLDVRRQCIIALIKLDRASNPLPEPTQWHVPHLDDKTGAGTIPSVAAWDCRPNSRKVVCVSLT